LGWVHYGARTGNCGARKNGFVATKDLSLRVEAGARHALIGPNGAGDAIMRHRVSFRDDRSGEE
jgi:ABC-type branched-subunit amino acid transport system ATPase component